jgi:hypothetical protein
LFIVFIFSIKVLYFIIQMHIQMKNIVLLFCVILFSVFSEVKAQTQIGTSAKVTAEVIEALTTKETAQLNFGRFSPETQGGKVILTPDGERSALGTVVLAGGTHNSASFYITGQPDATFSIALPSAPALLTNLQNDKTMQVSDWQSFPAPGIGVAKLIGGSMTVKVGASLIVGDMNANPKGLYAGTYSVTFAYN